MRVAMVSDVHGNLTALEAVLADLKTMAPDVVLHGGDLADAGSSPVEVVDRVRELGWRGVMGNTDQMLCEPESLEQFARGSRAPAALWDAVRAMAAATRDRLGAERLAWLRGLPLVLAEDGFALVHASLESCWKTLPEGAGDAEVAAMYGVLARRLVVYGHVHRPSVREIAEPRMTLVNAGSVGLPYDGDPRAAYLLLDEGRPEIRRVAYDVERELRALAGCGLPGAEWTARMLRTSSAQMP